MNCSELPLFGMCPLHDQSALVKCHLCKLIVKLPQLSEHLVKRHNMSEPETKTDNQKLKMVVEKIKNKINQSMSSDLKADTSPTTSPNGSRQKLNKTARVFDPDKHCGVLTDSVDSVSSIANGHERCLRSLTCKKHAINLRRQVSGRSKPFNELLKEYKKEKPDKLDTESVNKKNRKLIKKCESLPSPKVETKNEPVMLGPMFAAPVFVDPVVRPQKLTLNNLNLQYVKHHPRPSAVTSYNARLTDGGGYTVWNRRQDNLRLILSKTFIETEKFSQKNTTTSIPMGSDNALKRAFPFTSLIKSSSLSQVDSIHKLNEFLIDGDIFQNDEEEAETSKMAKLADKSEKSLGSPSSSSSASSMPQFVAQSSK